MHTTQILLRRITGKANLGHCLGNGLLTGIYASLRHYIGLYQMDSAGSFVETHGFRCPNPSNDVVASQMILVLLRVSLSAGRETLERSMLPQRPLAARNLRTPGAANLNPNVLAVGKHKRRGTVTLNTAQVVNIVLLHRHVGNDSRKYEKD